MKKKITNLEPSEELRTLIPSLGELETHELGTRIDAISKCLGTRENAAYIAGLSVDQLVSYIKGRSKPGFLPLARLARATGFSLDWLATGKGMMLQVSDRTDPTSTGYMDAEALGAAIKLMEQIGADLPLVRKARLTALAYDLMTFPEQPMTLERVQRLISSGIKE